MDDQIVTLCVLLWANDGCGEDMARYEDAVLTLVAEHGGQVISRVGSSGGDGAPDEVHVLEFADQVALDAYMSDERRLALADERDRVIARTEVIRVERLV